jgi:hypothetical protein
LLTKQAAGDLVVWAVRWSSTLKEKVNAIIAVDEVELLPILMAIILARSPSMLSIYLSAIVKLT